MKKEEKERKKKGRMGLGKAVSQVDNTHSSLSQTFFFGGLALSSSFVPSFIHSPLFHPRF
uniref:Uncharacterized protein n=1 Tax=Cucumis melo TaxID=3656 RepID=A0A9I9EFI8_CUCME